MSDWIKLHRRIRKHWLWEHPEFYQAWSDMLMMANWKDQKRVYKDEIIIIERGSFPIALRKLADRWGFSLNKLNRFLKLLKKDTMIDTHTDFGFTLVKIVNYKQYQVKNDTQTDTIGDTIGDTVVDTIQGTTIRSKEVKKVKEVNGETKVSLISHFGNAFKKYTGVEYHASFGKDGKLLKSLEQHYGYVGVIEGIDYFFSEFIKGDKFSKKNPNVGMLHSVWNGMVAKSMENKQRTDELREWVNE